MKDAQQEPLPALPPAVAEGVQLDQKQNRQRRAAPERIGFPIVGIGASAGGLEALEHFFKHTPCDSGMGFVIVQHLDPSKKGLMPELLQRTTSMPVLQAKNRMRVRPNTVHVIPPNKDLSILHGVLHLFELMMPRGRHLPIDFFFRALAKDQHHHAVGVILSGLGSDGTLGLRAIRENAGLTLVQDPANAEFDSMPQHAIHAGLADIIAVADELPAKITSSMGHAATAPRSGSKRETRTGSALEKVVILLRERTGTDFSGYKPTSMHRRIERRMGLHQIGEMPDYIRFLRENPQELDLLSKELLIGVTSFFRDADLWTRLRTDVLPALMAGRSTETQLRAWVAGCSTGEEAYSLAITFMEAMDSLPSGARYSLQIFATDLDADAIDRARRGLYPHNIIADVSPQRLARYFIETETGFRITTAIREMVTFAQQNLLMDPPFSRMDIISCRNLMIYLNEDAQNRTLSMFHYALNPMGLLILGQCETTSISNELFSTLAAHEKILQRNAAPTPASLADYPNPRQRLQQHRDVSIEPADRASLGHLVSRILRLRYAPPAVLVTVQGDVLYVSGSTGQYLEPAAGKANWNIFAMARDGLRYPLEDAMKQVTTAGGTVTLKGLRLCRNAETQWLNLTLEAVDHPGHLSRCILIVFSEVASPPRIQSRQPVGGDEPQLLAELTQAHQELRGLRDELRGAREELQSSTEELHSNIEELQSTNEELLTSKEELESLNEELQTVNAELQIKVENLIEVQDDMENMLHSTELACIFLDKKLRIRSFTPFARDTFKLLPIDVGRPLSDIVTDLEHPQLYDDMKGVLDTLQYVEKSIKTRDGRWYKVRIMPYHTANDRIDGLVITLVDISQAKKLELDLRKCAAGCQWQSRTEACSADE